MFTTSKTEPNYNSATGFWICVVSAVGMMALLISVISLILR